MQSHLLSYQSSSIHYITFGEGPLVTCCFHGYGEAAESFLILQPHTQHTHTCIAIDLPYHGKTIWNEGENFTTQQLQQIIDAILHQQQIKQQKFSLIGFSMGGRVALQLIQTMPQQIQKVLLIAPDGMKMNPWYWLATQTTIGNNLFKKTMQYPNWFFGMMKLANKTSLINQSIFKFAHHYLDDEQVRHDLYQRWTCMRKFKPDLNTIQKNIIKQKILVRLLYGQFDRIIQPKNAMPFINGIEEYASITIIPSGHQLLHKKNAVVIAQLLNN